MITQAEYLEAKKIVDEYERQTPMIDYTKIKLVRTCESHPEQYDAFLKRKKVGYLRLRHGFFTVDFPNVYGENIYKARPKGDGYFEDHERDRYLTEAKIAIAKRLALT